MKKNLALAVLFFLVSFVSFGQLKSLENAVEELRELMINPQKAELTSLCHFKLSYGHSSAKIESREEFVEALMSKKYDFEEIKLSQQTIDIIDDSAIVRHNLWAKTRDGGRPGEVNLHVLTVWLKQKKGWVLFARQAVKI